MTLLERDREKIEEGREAGRIEGRREGREEGREEGKEEGKLEIARNMKALGFNIDAIVKATGLSKEQVLKI